MLSSDSEERSRMGHTLVDFFKSCRGFSILAALYIQMTYTFISSHDCDYAESEALLLIGKESCGKLCVILSEQRSVAERTA